MNVSAFVPVSRTRIAKQQSFILSSSDDSGAALSRKATLDQNQLWRLTIRLEKQGFSSVEAIARVRFIEYRNIEPPGGRIFVEDDYNGFLRVDEKGYGAFAYTLSEDKDDRKDGLWIWGLFEEPKYPYLYFSLAVWSSVILTSGEEESVWNDTFGELTGNKLDIRFDHYREDGNVFLKNGQITFTPQNEKVKLAFGAGEVNVGEPTVCGKVSIEPVFT